MDKTTVLKPRLSEKAYGLSQARNTYVFDVPHDANKHTVARAVATQFSVTVTDVNVANIKGKAKRTVRKNGRAAMGRQNAIRKAYVTLKAGDSLPLFAAVEEETAKADKTAEVISKAQAKIDKKADKKTDKETVKADKKEAKEKK
jgi:large subunit ribosomal protein L23